MSPNDSICVVGRGAGGIKTPESRNARLTVDTNTSAENPEPLIK